LHVRINPYWQRVTEWEQRDGLETVKQIGGTVVRVYVFSIDGGKRNQGRISHYYGSHDNGEPILDEELFKDYDRLLMLCNEYGIRLMIPFIDEWDWRGGVNHFAALNGGGHFYTDRLVIERFKKYIAAIMNRKNSLTGVYYKDDKAIFGWETGNELQNVPEAWTKEIALHIKSINKNHLVIDGVSHPVEASINGDYIDVISSHFYPHTHPNYAKGGQDDAIVCKGRKPFIIGEFGCSPTSDIVIELMDEVLKNHDIQGALLWSIRFQSEQGGYYWHNDWSIKAYHWPGFTTNDASDEIKVLQKLTESAHAIRGLQKPTLKVPVVPEIIQSSAVNAISWKGSTGAKWYSIERATSPNGPWQTVADSALNCQEPFEPFNDITAPVGQWGYYRMKAANETGSSDFSQVVKLPYRK
jgi:hypothetical protein